MSDLTMGILNSFLGIVYMSDLTMGILNAYLGIIYTHHRYS